MFCKDYRLYGTQIPLFGEVAVEAIQLKVHSDVSVQMTLGNSTKVTQITYLTAPQRRARRDDQNGHLDHPIRSPDGKVMSPKRSPTWPSQAGRPGQGRPAWHLPQNTLHSVSWPWGLTNSPLTHGRQARSETKTERPHMSLQWASKVTKLSIKTQTNWRRNIQPLIDMLVQRRAERSQLQAGRARRGRPAY